MSENNIFEPINLFLFRSPVMSLNLYKDAFIYNDKFPINDYIEDDIINEAILVASKNLSDSMKSYKKEKRENKKEKVIEGISKYFNRATTRTIPFGLFAGVTIGEFSKETGIYYGKDNLYKKVAKVDCKWLYKIVKTLELKEKAYKYLKLYTNELISYEGNKVKNLYETRYGQFEIENAEIKSYVIDYSENVQVVFDICNNGGTYREIIEYFKGKYDDFESDVIDRFLETLIENEYIYTELRPSSTNENQLLYVINTLKEKNFKNYIVEKLEKINELINEYNGTEVGKGVTLYNRIISLMEEINTENNYIQVDMVGQYNIELNNSIKEEISNALNFLISLSSEQYKPNYLLEYEDKFVEKYGTSTLVKLKDLLDEQKGLGAPDSYFYPKNGKGKRKTAIINKSSERKGNFIRGKILDAIVTGKDEIVLKDDDIDKVKNEKVNIDKLPLSIELYVKVIAESVEAIQNGDYEVVLNSENSSNGVGKSFGRFINILDKKYIKEFKEYYESEQEIIGDDVIIAEVVMFPHKGRLANVTATKNFRDYEVDMLIGEKTNKIKVDLDDIYVGLGNNGFYFKSKSLNKKVKFSTNHMLNIIEGNNIYRFIREVSEGSVIDPLSFLYLPEISKAKYIPRIKYGKVILYPKSYKLSYYDCVNLEKATKNEFILGFEKWREAYKVPQLLYIVDSDNRLLLNLDNDEHKNYIYKLLKNDKKSIFKFEEYRGNIDKSWFKRDNRIYESQIVLPLIRSMKNKYENANDYATEMIMKDRIIYPGGEWLYVKLYHNDDRCDELIGCYIRKFMEELKENNYIYNHFFIRYVDELTHIRLRMKINNNKLGGILKFINQWVSEMNNIGLIKKVSIDTYEREIERYGGDLVIKKVENFFCDDSKIVERYLELRENGETDISEEEFAVLNIINVMDELEVSYEKQMTMFDKIVSFKDYRKEFQKNRKKILNLILTEEIKEKHKEIYDLIKEESRAANKLKKELDKIESMGNLCNSKEEIFYSLVHIHCNRLIGIDAEREKKVMTFVRHSLYSLKHFRKKE